MANACPCYLEKFSRSLNVDTCLNKAVFEFPSTVTLYADWRIEKNPQLAEETFHEYLATSFIVFVLFTLFRWINFNIFCIWVLQNSGKVNNFSMVFNKIGCLLYRRRYTTPAIAYTYSGSETLSCSGIVYSERSAGFDRVTKDFH